MVAVASGGGARRCIPNLPAPTITACVAASQSTPRRARGGGGRPHRRVIERGGGEEGKKQPRHAPRGSRGSFL
eukprot:scaffold148490_cov31-Tisochrysis_lutea.AAC.1